MPLFRLTFATIFQRKAWVICVLAVIGLPFVLPVISSASENFTLIKPARIQAAWATLWICTLLWGLFTAAKQGEANAKTGMGEYFFTTGISNGKQLFQIWLAVFAFIAPLAICTAGISQFAATPGATAEKSMWWTLNFQYLTLFLLVVGPLLALAIGLASRFGGIVGFAGSLGIALYGLYGVGYLDNLLKIESHPMLQSIWLISPQYRFADLTQRLYFKDGALPAAAFRDMVFYFVGILAIYCGVSRFCFRAKLST
ncbi:hypothetical protein JIN85_09275 [Luteolibacter pohnpeiensis]|uniref:Uncharacterized protein n=1 Tax=Luteolibacter pohnpeiensis TaxID=454153 RepID=A0A934VQY7_9BACT|nr:hypothetical protein [Luteolibacter pohnpeiensis]MBK1882606.1 hypothetical protein [Luteolibacter pohnpeiensis]